MRCIEREFRRIYQLEWMRWCSPRWNHSRECWSSFINRLPHAVSQMLLSVMEWLVHCSIQSCTFHMIASQLFRGRCCRARQCNLQLDWERVTGNNIVNISRLIHSRLSSQHDGHRLSIGLEFPVQLRRWIRSRGWAEQLWFLPGDQLLSLTAFWSADRDTTRRVCNGLQLWYFLS